MKTPDAVARDPAFIAATQRIALLEMQLRDANARLAIQRIELIQANGARNTAVSELTSLLVTQEHCPCRFCAEQRIPSP